MRIKISVDHSTTYKNINIQNIVFKHKESLPTIYFKCHKRFENIFTKETIIFHNHKGQEIFRSNNLKVDYRYYEDDRSKEKKVRVVVRDIEFENYGKVSNYYLQKTLKKACNAKIIKTQQNRKSKYGTGVMRYVEKIKAMKYKSSIYKNHEERIRYVVKQVIEKIYKMQILSTAPT